MLIAFLNLAPPVALGILVLLGLLIWGIWQPLVWRIFSVFGMAAGTGFVVWGILTAALHEQPPRDFPGPAGIIAIGAGVLVGSIALLAISFFGRKPAGKE